MPKGRAIVTEMTVSPASGLHLLELWHGIDPAQAAATLGLPLPAPGRAEAFAGGHVLRLAPRRWWIDGAAPEVPADLGAQTPMGGGWTRVAMAGPDWRDVMMHSGLIDVETPAFGPGSVVITPLCHVRSVLHCLDADTVHIHVPASTRDHCLAMWRDLGARMAQPL